MLALSLPIKGPTFCLPDRNGACPIGLRIGPKELRKELTPLSSVAYGATRWPGFKVFA